MVRSVKGLKQKRMKSGMIYEKMKRHKESLRKEDEEAASEGMKMFDGVG